MKNLLPLTLALTILALPLKAEETLDKDSQCAKLSELSGVIMEARQAGVPLSNALDMVRNYNDFIRLIVLDAWESPRYGSTYGAMQREVDDFRDRWHVACLRSPWKFDDTRNR